MPTSTPAGHWRRRRHLSSLSASGRTTGHSEELHSRELEKSNSNYGNTWVQPLIGVFGTYAISEDWQAFAYLDAGGFGLSGERDLSGTAQAGIAYALGNSAQTIPLLQIFRP